MSIRLTTPSDLRCTTVLVFRRTATVVVHTKATQTKEAPQSRLDVFAEATGVVVSDRARVTERLQDRVGLQHLLLDRAELRRARPTAENGQVLHNDFARFCLPCARLAAHQDGLLAYAYARVAYKRDTQKGGGQVRFQEAKLLEEKKNILGIERSTPLYTRVRAVLSSSWSVPSKLLPCWSWIHTCAGVRRITVCPRPNYYHAAHDRTAAPWLSRKAAYCGQ